MTDRERAAALNRQADMRAAALRQRLFAMMAAISVEGPVYEPLGLAEVRERFLAYLIDVNPLASEITYDFLRRHWTAYLKVLKLPADQPKPF